jgi:hypothetical protein
MVPLVPFGYGLPPKRRPAPRTKEQLCSFLLWGTRSGCKILAIVSPLIIECAFFTRSLSLEKQH